ncbi:hypothetical protein BC834DRAFT_970543 [Gloeopeniophorella convolvens]|nr:hypothetical protein BC834DRAFT_970543 [Gloeopeniophorella convolvens]
MDDTLDVDTGADAEEDADTDVDAADDEDKTSNVIDLYKYMLHTVEDLATCSSTAEAFTGLLSRINRLSLEGNANLDHQVAELDKKIEGILLQRLKHVIQVWCAEFDRSTDDSCVRRNELPSKRRGNK